MCIKRPTYHDNIFLKYEATYFIYQKKRSYQLKNLPETKLKNALNYIPVNITNGPLTPFAMAITDKTCIVPDDPVESYRNYYRMQKRHLASWTKRPIPEWYY